MWSPPPRAWRGGLPMGAVPAWRKDRQDVLAPGTHGSTFGGNPVLRRGGPVRAWTGWTDELMAEVAAKGRVGAGGTDTAPRREAVSGRGLMLGVESGKPAAALVSDLLARGVVIAHGQNQAAAAAAAHHPDGLISSRPCPSSRRR